MKIKEGIKCFYKVGEINNNKIEWSINEIGTLDLYYDNNDHIIKFDLLESKFLNFDIKNDSREPTKEINKNLNDISNIIYTKNNKDFIQFYPYSDMDFLNN